MKLEAVLFSAEREHSLSDAQDKLANDLRFIIFMYNNLLLAY